jgi:hypothetical protein
MERQASKDYHGWAVRERLICLISTGYADSHLYSIGHRRGHGGVDSPYFQRSFLPFRFPGNLHELSRQQGLPAGAGALTTP